MKKKHTIMNLNNKSHELMKWKGTRINTNERMNVIKCKFNEWIEWIRI